MESSYTRLKRIQQRIWRRAANALLMLNQHLTISLSFIVIIVFGVFWIVLEQKLEQHLFNNAQNYGYGVARYASTDLGQLLIDNDSKGQSEYLKRLVNSPLIESASLYNQQGALLTEQFKSESSTDKSIRYITLLQDIESEQGRLGILKIKLDRTQQEAPIKELMNNLAMIAVILMILSSVAAWFIAQFLIKPVNRLFSQPLTRPDSEKVEQLDVAEELQQILEKSGYNNKSPAPISEMESAGIHKILAVESNAIETNLIILHLYLSDLPQWIDSRRKSDVVPKLREIDRRILVSVHGQSGVLLNFDGLNATASFDLTDAVDNPEFKALSCAQLLIELMTEIGVQAKVHIKRENRILLKHRHRTPIAVPLVQSDHEITFAHQTKDLLIHKSLQQSLIDTKHIELEKLSNDWYGLCGQSDSAKSMLQRQKDWTQYLLDSE